MKPLSLGHVHLKVRALAPAIEFYTKVVGLTVEEICSPIAFLTDGNVHHLVALQALGDNAVSPAVRGVGLYHTAFEAESVEAFRDTYLRLKEMSVEVHPVDHQISWAIYCTDPDGNGVEVYLDRRKENTGTEKWGGKSTILAPETFGA